MLFYHKAGRIEVDKLHSTRGLLMQPNFIKQELQLCITFFEKERVKNLIILLIIRIFAFKIPACLVVFVCFIAYPIKLKTG